MNRIKCKNINQLIHKLLVKSEVNQEHRVYRQLWISQHGRHVIATDIELTWNENGLRWFEGKYGNVYVDGTYEVSTPYACNVTELINA